jgi:hypothetical protein
MTYTINAQSKTEKVIALLKKGKTIKVFSPYFLKHNVLYNEAGHALKFGKGVDPISDITVKIGDYFKVGYEQGWMLEGAPSKVSMCSINCDKDFITRWQYTLSKIIKIDRSKKSYDASQTTNSFDELDNQKPFLCSYKDLLAAIKRDRLSINITEEGTLSLVNKELPVYEEGTPFLMHESA